MEDRAPGEFLKCPALCLLCAWEPTLLPLRSEMSITSDCCGWKLLTNIFITCIFFFNVLSHLVISNEAKMWLVDKKNTWRHRGEGREARVETVLKKMYLSVSDISNLVFVMGGGWGGREEKNAFITY